MSAHVDTFVRDNLPPREQWPELTFNLPELQFPAQYNASSILDRAIANGLGANNAVLCGAVALSYNDLLRDAARLGLRYRRPKEDERDQRRERDGGENEKRPKNLVGVRAHAATLPLVRPRVARSNASKSRKKPGNSRVVKGVCAAVARVFSTRGGKTPERLALRPCSSRARGKPPRARAEARTL